MPSFMDLPPETRIEIFGYVIPEHVVVDLTRQPWESPVLDTTLPPYPHLPLLLTNSVINAEALLIPEPRLVARFTNWHNCLVWLQQTPPSYRAKFSNLRLSTRERYRTEDPQHQQRRVDSANKEPLCGPVEHSYKDHLKRAFDVVKFVYSERWGVITTKKTAWGKKGAYLCEERCWNVSGAKKYKVKHQLCGTRRQQRENAEALLQKFMH